VHGAWHGSWCWERLVPLLAARGLATRTLDLPSVHGGSAARGRAPGLAADAAAVRALIDAVSRERGGPILLCGHSYGGMVISLAAARERRIARLLYLCAFMPQEGQSLLAAGGNRYAPWVRMLDEGRTLPDLEQAAEVFYQDCDRSLQHSAIARLKPQWAAAFEEPVARPAWAEIPSTYLLCARDQAIPVSMQRELFAPRASAVLELDCGHSPFLSQPQALAQALAGWQHPIGYN